MKILLLVVMFGLGCVMGFLQGKNAGFLAADQLSWPVVSQSIRSMGVALDKLEECHLAQRGY